MNIWKKPWLWLPPQTSQKWGQWALRAYGATRPYQTLTWKPFSWRHLEFNNPVGTAGGVDKNGDLIKSLWALGTGFVEVGTVTPEPQAPLPGKILDRNLNQKSLWNKMGFPNKGALSMAECLKHLYEPHFTPIFVNIGKNRWTPNEQAHNDYIHCIHKLTPYADAFVLNISSPNTEGLRDLLQPSSLRPFLESVLSANRTISQEHQKKTQETESQPTPLLLKLSPDMSPSQLKSVCEVSEELDIDGWILTNTTAERTNSNPFPKTGGLSGQPLSELSKRYLKTLLEITDNNRHNKLLVSVGGVLSEEDVFERLDMGAHLVQMYSALIFNGPFFFRQIADKAETLGLK